MVRNGQERGERGALAKNAGELAGSRNGGVSRGRRSVGGGGEVAKGVCAEERACGIEHKQAGRVGVVRRPLLSPRQDARQCGLPTFPHSFGS